MTLPLRRALCVTALGLASGSAATAQPSGIEWSGLAYLDYSATLAHPDPDQEGANTFDYRRLYLTADIDLADDFRARARLEANSASTTAQGRPSPFMKDVWLRWRYADAGHQATLGVQPPPVFEVSESVWGYRSLDKTILDRSRVRESRDFGIRLDGPMGRGGVRYAAMVANGNGVGAEAEDAQGKRVYGQLAYVPDGPFRAAIGADYTGSDPDAEVRQSSTRVSAFVGAVTARARGGVEAFVAVEDAEDPALDTSEGLGLSVFGAVDVAPRTSVVARYDFLDATAGRSGADEHYVLAAVAYRPTPAVSLMPNVIVTVPDGTDATVLGRFTASVQF